SSMRTHCSRWRPSASRSPSPEVSAMNKRSVDIWERVAWFGSLPLIVALWELVVRAGVVNPVLFPPPSVVAVSMVDYAKSGLLAADLGWSVSRVAVGYL